MARSVQEDVLLSHNVEFAQNVWKIGLRPDKRAALQAREISVEFPLLSRDTVQVRCGETSVIAKTACELVEPNPYRPKHGFFNFQSRQLFQERDNPQKVKELKKLNSFLERLFRDNVVETEGLCVLPGRRVWSLQVSVIVVNDEGNVKDVAQWAVLNVLRHFRRPQITLRGDEITVHPPHEREPTPLALHHLPVCTSLAVTLSPKEVELEARVATLQNRPNQNENALWLIVDPTATESRAAASLITVAVNAEGMVCALERTEGCDVSWDLIQKCIEAATNMSKYVLQIGEDAARAHEEKIKAAIKSQFAWAKERLGVGKSNDDAAEPPLKKQKTDEPTH
ncbi:exosome complex component RRP45 [Angomonas deanei]|uniref:3' exoribonuclease family, domain 1, putative n=1 Tax=Angomonas deanei TaxID=59799 RepID=S9X2R0_9TRYP|nr:exosome complex component RRP45 [Angomonas deanei]EPY42670.1 exosome complex component RRP45 [Angomonas deanei]CAD2220562.1 3' exoribonuclease family, domain 1, putative [Angomonas deanei]|eukprot:EPY33400.1 exosome complex component RRP45 [Angomonas deanei]